MKTIIRKNSVFGNHQYVEINDHRPEPIKIGTHKTVVFKEKNCIILNADEKYEDTTKVIYHETAVVTFNKYTILLDTGGYKTRTTKLRMNQTSQVYNLGFKVFQKNKKWYVEFNGVTKQLRGVTMVISRDGCNWENEAQK